MVLYACSILIYYVVCRRGVEEVCIDYPINQNDENKNTKPEYNRFIHLNLLIFYCIIKWTYKDEREYIVYEHIYIILHKYREFTVC